MLPAFLALCAVVAVAGCFKSSATPQTIVITLPPSTPAPTATPIAIAPTGAPGTTAGSPVDASLPTVSTTNVTDVAGDGRWKVTFKMPVVAGAGAGVSAAKAMNDTIKTRVNAYIVSFNGAGLPVVGPGEAPSTLAGDYSVAYTSATLLSLRFAVSTDITGAAPPTTEAGSINFDVASGAAIQLMDIFTSPGEALPVLQTQAHAKLTALLGAGLSWPASSTMSDFGGAWAFTGGGLELSWSQGHIAKPAAGTPRITIPWAALKSVIAKPGPAAGFVP